LTAATAPAQEAPSGTLAVLRNRSFLALWLAQAVTQIGGNMVIYGLTVIIFSATKSNSAVSFLLLTFLVPAVIFSAVAGVYVDRHDRRLILIIANLLRAVAFGVIFVAHDQLAVVYAMNIFVSTVTTFFGPAEAAMIPYLVPRSQLLAANSIFTLTMNAAFALGFALLGPLVVTLAGPNVLILLVGLLYLVAAFLCITLPAARPAEPDERSSRQAVAAAEQAVGATLGQLKEGLQYIAGHRNIGWSLIYLGITASLIGVLGVLGPDFATESLGLAPKDFVVVVLPMGFGIVTGILVLNAYGKMLPRRRVIETGLLALGLLLMILSVAGRITRFLQNVNQNVSSATPVDLSAVVSLLSIVIGIAFLAGISYAVVAIPAQTQLQEDLPEEVRGRVFGVLNMLVSVASFLPIIVVGPISDFFGTSPVIFAVGLLVAVSGFASVALRDRKEPWRSTGTALVEGRAPGAVDPVAVVLSRDKTVARAAGTTVGQGAGMPVAAPAVAADPGGSAAAVATAIAEAESGERLAAEPEPAEPMGGAVAASGADGTDAWSRPTGPTEPVMGAADSVGGAANGTAGAAADTGADRPAGSPGPTDTTTGDLDGH
jgi:MFS family permease